MYTIAEGNITAFLYEDTSVGVVNVKPFNTLSVRCSNLRSLAASSVLPMYTVVSVTYHVNCIAARCLIKCSIFIRL